MPLDLIRNLCHHTIMTSLYIYIFLLGLLVLYTFYQIHQTLKKRHWTIIRYFSPHIVSRFGEGSIASVVEVDDNNQIKAKAKKVAVKFFNSEKENFAIGNKITMSMLEIYIRNSQ